MENGIYANKPFWINRLILIATFIAFTANIIKLFK